MSQFINTQLQKYRHQMEEIVKDLHQFTILIGHSELSQTVSDLRNRIHEPFMFVIVGEVKAGKSSFINALLETDREICKVAPQPMTDTIQQIIWGEEEETVQINEYLRKVSLPVEILKEIAIVDTPGTNTIVAHHQEITERFIPASDLIVFVFEAKNPYRQSAWDFFEFIHADWRRKVIFVLQQKDLMSAEDLQVNFKGVIEQAQKKGIFEPRVFAVSAKEELENHKEESGFAPIREFIRTNITGGKAPMLKLINNIDTCVNINERIQSGLTLRKEQWQLDGEFRKDIRQTLDQQETKSNRELAILVENLLGAYDRATRKTELELSEGLSLPNLLKRSFSSLFSSSASAKEWLDALRKDLDRNLQLELRERLEDSVTDLADSIQQMAKIIDLKIQNSKTILKGNHDIFSDISDRRSNVLRDLQEAFAKFINRAENFRDDSLFPQNSSLTPNIVSGSGIAIIGIVLAAVTHTTVLDITGGLLTTIGLLFAGVTILISRRKIIGGYHSEILKGRNNLEKEVTDKLQTYIRHIKQRIDSNFHTFDAMIENEEMQINMLEERFQDIKDRLGKLKAELD